MQSPHAIGCFAREVEAVSFNYLRREWNILDPALAEDFKQLEKVQDAEFSVVSETADQRTWVVTFSKDNGPSASYIYNRCCSVCVVARDVGVLAANAESMQFPSTCEPLMARPNTHSSPAQMPVLVSLVLAPAALM